MLWCIPATETIDRERQLVQGLSCLVVQLREVRVCWLVWLMKGKKRGLIPLLRKRSRRPPGKFSLLHGWTTSAPFYSDSLKSSETLIGLEWIYYLNFQDKTFLKGSLFFKWRNALSFHSSICPFSDDVSLPCFSISYLAGDAIDFRIVSPVALQSNIMKLEALLGLTLSPCLGSTSNPRSADFTIEKLAVLGRDRCREAPNNAEGFDQPWPGSDRLARGS